MNILFTSFAYYPESSGVPIVVQYLAEGLAKLGNKVSVVTRKNGYDLESKELVNNVQVFRFDIGQDIFKRDVGNVKEYIKFVLEFPKDVLIMECVQCHTTDILLPHLSKMNCKIVIHSHGGPGINQKIFKWNTNIKHTIGNTHNWLRWKKYYTQTFPSAAKFIDAVICLSLCASDLKYMNKTIKKVYILENAASDIFFSKDYHNVDISDILKLRSSEYMLCIANYIPNKSQLDIIRSYEKIKNDKCALVLIGSSPNNYSRQVSVEAERVIRHTGKEIKVLWDIERKYFPSIISHAKLFVMASRHEEYPVSLVEAMACGTPFVSTNAGCSRILPGGVTVIDRKELSLYMDILDSTPDMLSRLSEQGRQYASLNNQVSNVIFKLSKILNSL